MPTLTITVWNIQDYGNNSTTTRGTYTPLHNFIAKVLKQQETDVFYLMELRQGGVPQLANLRAALAAQIRGNGWYYDWIKGAIKSTTADDREEPNINVTTAAQLDWAQSANKEGYAMFFVNDPTKFTMTLAPPVGAPDVANTLSNGVQRAPVPPAIPAHALSLVLTGRPVTGETPGSSWSYNATRFTPGAPPVWNNLNFPRPASGKLQRSTSRRPAFCVIRLTGGDAPADALMPLMVYHAPSRTKKNSPNAPPSGTQAASFARQLYQARDPATAPAWNWINNKRALACGDFNVDGNPPALPRKRSDAYLSYTKTFANAGAGMTHTTVPLFQDERTNNTAVSLNRGIGGRPIPDGDATDFRDAEFDNLFTRGIPAQYVQAPPPNGNIYDLITAVRPRGNLTGAPVMDFMPLVDGVTRGTRRGVDGEPLKPNGRKIYPMIVNWANFYSGLTAGAFPDNRSAAEFIWLFVSDHLPVTFRFTY